ncbi:ribonuclease HII [Gracilimonas amylolytica]|uniref:ribonuclease HII n=1 Tax=Gracilimonas amylolytica TaxID=1749045 RepID=UPI000CD907E2|nr:ribonuclease HII [Gracilimonas amylolytica]
MSDRLKFERQLWREGFERIIGLDEVGRGCLAGPVVAAGVVFKKGTDIPEIRDSKGIGEKERMELSERIKEEALCWSVQEGSIEEINELNILWASLHTMQKCVDAIDPSPDYLLVDGNRYLTSMIPHTCLVKGDDRSMSIAAASILAKVYRDDLMKKLHDTYPEYGWDSNVGYPTAPHKKALKIHGYTEYHRTTFNLGTEKIRK